MGEGWSEDSRTLMVTLLGVRAIGRGSLTVFACCGVGPVRGEDAEALATSKLLETASAGPADMLLRTRSPLSKRGRFLVLGESASSIGTVCCCWGPVDLARLGVEGCSFRTESMTWLVHSCPGQ